MAIRRTGSLRRKVFPNCGWKEKLSFGNLFVHLFYAWDNFSTLQEQVMQRTYIL